MEKPIEPIKSMLSAIKTDLFINNNTQNATIKVLPQMPHHQIQHFVTQAALNNIDVTVQFNSSVHFSNIQEVKGKITIIPKSNTVIINDNNQPNLTYLNSIYSIRHLRLSN